MKRLRVIFLAALVLALLCALVACGAEIDSGTTNGENPGGNTADAGGATSGENNGNGTAGGGEHTHAHTYSDTWSQDATYHWHAATCEHTNEIKDKAEHNYVDGTCSVCGRVQMAGAESLQYALSADQKAYHVVGVGTEQNKNLVIPASYRDLPVTEIADEAFFGCTWLKSVVIPVLRDKDWRGRFFGLYKSAKCCDTDRGNDSCGKHFFGLYKSANAYITRMGTRRHSGCCQADVENRRGERWRNNRRKGVRQLYGFNGNHDCIKRNHNRRRCILGVLESYRCSVFRDACRVVQHNRLK